MAFASETQLSATSSETRIENTSHCQQPGTTVVETRLVTTQHVSHTKFSLLPPNRSHPHPPSPPLRKEEIAAP